MPAPNLTDQANSDNGQILCFNGQFVSESSISLDHQNRSFRYGDGLFETIALRNGETCYLADHLERAWKGSLALGLKWEQQFPEVAALEVCLLQLAVLNKLEQFARFRWQIWRSGNGKYAAETDSVNYLISVLKGSKPTLGRKRAGIFYDIPVTYSSISSFKTCSALPYVLAANAAQRSGLEEMILLSAGNGAVAEATASNLFWISDNQLFTPALQTGCIDGIMRKQVFKWCETNGQSIQSGSYSIEHLLAADCVFTTNSSGMQHLTEVAGKPFGADHALVEQLFRDLLLK